MKKNKLSKIFIAVFLLICLVPSLGMVVAKSDATSENRKLAEFPSFITEDNKYNVQFFTELGDYFNDHFAFRSYIISIDSFIQAKLFGTSNVDTVVVGTDGWLYYKDTLDNYKGQNLMSGREMNNVIHNIMLLKEYVEQSGSQFVLTIAPNKNTLYPDNMPYYLKSKVSDSSDADELGQILEEKGVNYVDLFDLFKEQNEVLYFKRDSHWNTMGAHLVYNEIMDSIGVEYDDYSSCEVKTNENYLGDLHKMVYPLSDEGEADKYYDYEKTYQVTTPDESPEAPLIVTKNESKGSSLLMYRDSFGNSLYPIFANAFGFCAFSKATPYNLSLNMLGYAPEVVVVEKVERNLSDFAKYPAVFPSFERQMPGSAQAIDQKIELTAEICQTNTGYIELSGVVDGHCISETGVVYVRVVGENKESFFEASSLSTDDSHNGFKIILEKDKFLSDTFTAEVYIENSGEYTKTASQIIDISNIQEVEF